MKKIAPSLRLVIGVYRKMISFYRKANESSDYSLKDATRFISLIHTLAFSQFLNGFVLKTNVL